MRIGNAKLAVAVSHDVDQRAPDAGHFLKDHLAVSDQVDVRAEPNGIMQQLAPGRNADDAVIGLGSIDELMQPGVGQRGGCFRSSIHELRSVLIRHV